MASTDLKKGEWAPPPPNALRSPCPFVNCLANHGLIPRDGRNITADELRAAMRHCGVGFDVAATLVKGSFAIHDDSREKPIPGHYHLGLREEDSFNSDGIPVLNLGQFSRPNAIEHDVSLSRQDREIGDPAAIDKELLEDLLKCNANEGYYTLFDLARRRVERYEEASRANPKMNLDPEHHNIACGEVAAFVAIFGRGLQYTVPKAYLQAVFGEERLPYKEGWSPRWTPMMFIEIVPLVKLVSYYCWPFKSAST